MLYIRDRIYGYIPISPLEEALLKQPEILRLHRILQNSTLYQTYPNNRTSRFSHSIGAMHVAGLLFKSLIANSNEDHVQELHKTAQEFLATATDHSESLDNARKYLIDSYKKKNVYADREIYNKNHLENDPKKVDFYSIVGWRMGGELEKRHVYEYEFYYNSINNILLQSIRLAALVHDIGHPPYSHACEYPLEDLASCKSDRWNNMNVNKSVDILVDDYLDIIAKYTLGREATKEDAQDLGIEKGHLHEMIGVILINDLYDKDRIRSKDADEKEFWRICLKIALRIISVEQLGHFLSPKFTGKVSQVKTKDKLLGWYALGNLINGPVDCDRLDFLQRDPENSGVSDLGSFDFTNIVNSIMLVHPKPTDNFSSTLAEQILVPGFDRRSVSSLTDFFNDRMRQYRWLVNHHNVVRTDLAMSRLILNLANIYDKGTNDIICNVLKKYNFQGLWDWKNLLDNFRYIDDSWLETMFQDLYKTIEYHVVKSEEFGNDMTKEVEIDECWLFLKVIFDRSVRNLNTIWKRIDGFEPFAQGLLMGFKQELNEKPIPKIEGNTEIIKLIREDATDDNAIFRVNHLLDFWNDIVRLKPYTVMEKVEQIVNIKHQGRILFVLKSTHPYEIVPIVKRDGTISYLENMSSLVYLLSDIYSHDLKLYAYQLPPKKEGGYFYDIPTDKEEWDTEATRLLGADTGHALAQCFREVSEG